MKILIGTLNFDSKAFTELWLESLEKTKNKAFNHNPGSYPKILTVVLNNSPEDDLSDLKAKYKDVVFLEPGKNLGVAAGWNELIKQGIDNNGNFLYDYYMPSNNDLYFTEDWLLNFSKGLKEHSDKSIAWISSMLNDFKEPELTGIIETVQLEGRYWGGIRQEADDIESVDQIKNMLQSAYSPFGGVEKFAENLKNKYGLKLKEMHQKAPCFALSKECLLKVGLFDEYNSPNGLHEDADYGKRIELAGMKFGVIFGAYVHHFSMYSRTRKKFKENWWVNSREKAFQEKWGVSSKEMHKITPETAKFRLDIGSGERPQRKDNEHWYHVDIDKQFPDVEFLRNVQDLSNLEDCSMKEIYTSNVIEHIEWKEILATLYEWYRVLDFGGKIEIRCPNATWLMKRVLEGSWNLELTEGVEFNAQHAFMGGDHPGTPHLHKVLLEEGNLSRAMKDVGFINIKNVSNPSSWELQIIAEK